MFPDRCARPAWPTVAANPSLPAGACGLTVMVVVDASASIDAGDVGDTLGAVVDGLVDTGSTVGLIELSSSVTVPIGATMLDGSSRGSFDRYVSGFSTGGTTDLAAGLAAAVAASPDLVVVVTDGVANASSAGPGQAVVAAVEQANRLKAAGSRVVAVEVGAADDTMLAAISGPRVGRDVATADHSVGGGAAMAASLGTAVTAGCPDDPGDVTAAASSAPAAGAAAVTNAAVGDFCNATPITIPEIGVASPYPSTITVDGAGAVAPPGERQVVQSITVTLAGITHPRASDLDVLLVGPTGLGIVLMSDTGGGNANGVTVTFDAAATGRIAGELEAGAYLPSNVLAGDDVWPEPALASEVTILLSNFTFFDPNGVWSLYVVDDLASRPTVVVVVRSLVAGASRSLMQRSPRSRRRRTRHDSVRP